MKIGRAGLKWPPLDGLKTSFWSPASQWPWLGDENQCQKGLAGPLSPPWYTVLYTFTKRNYVTITKIHNCSPDLDPVYLSRLIFCHPSFILRFCFLFSSSFFSELGSFQELSMMCLALPFSSLISWVSLTSSGIKYHITSQGSFSWSHRNPDSAGLNITKMYYIIKQEVFR